MVNISKICTKCTIPKHLNQFSKNKLKKDGHHYVCKVCVSVYSKEYGQRPSAKLLKKASAIRFTLNRPRRRWADVTISVHRQKGYDVSDLSIDFVEQLALKTSHCYYCSKELNWNKKGPGPSHNSPTLDRINNENYLSKENVRIVCCSCNIRKGNFTHLEFIEYCQNIVKVFGMIK